MTNTVKRIIIELAVNTAVAMFLTTAIVPALRMIDDSILHVEFWPTLSGVYAIIAWRNLYSMTKSS